MVQPEFDKCILPTMFIWFLHKTPTRPGRQVSTRATTGPCAVIAALYCASGPQRGVLCGFHISRSRRGHQLSSGLFTPFPPRFRTWV